MEEGNSIEELPEMYAGKNSPGWDPSYDGSWGASLLFKARPCRLEVGARVGKWEGDESCLEGTKEVNDIAS